MATWVSRILLRYIKSAPITGPNTPAQKATGGARSGANIKALIEAITPGKRAGNVMPICGTGWASKLHTKTLNSTAIIKGNKTS